jgi:hypothetical protein
LSIVPPCTGCGWQRNARPVMVEADGTLSAISSDPLGPSIKALEFTVIALF